MAEKPRDAPAGSGSERQPNRLRRDGAWEEERVLSDRYLIAERRYHERARKVEEGHVESPGASKNTSSSAADGGQWARQFRVHAG